MSPFHAEFYGGDFSPEVVEGWKGKQPFTFAAGEYSENLIPDFNFSGWPEVGVYDYSETCAEIVKASKRDVKYNQLFWAGNSNTHRNRKRFVEMTKGDPRVHAHDVINWVPEAGLPRLKPISGVYTSLPDHCNYKYLIDIEGCGYSGRVKHLLHTGRPLFYVKRYWQEYFSFDLEPFVHYIPVENDLSDFYEKLEWAFDNDAECERIAKNAQEFAINNLKKEDAVDKWRDTLVKLGGVKCMTI